MTDAARNTAVAPSAPIAPVQVGALTPPDRDAWERLARGYHDFYRETLPAEAYEETWRRLMQRSAIFGAGAYLDGQLVGIVHHLFHEHVWSGKVCYLQDLFVDEHVRGNGIGRALIEHVSDDARERGAFRVYWSTAGDNTTARRLYDKVAQLTPFLRYDRPLS